MFTARNVLNDGAHVLDGLCGALVCDTRWSDHNTLHLRIRTHARIVNQCAKILSLQLFAPDERRPSATPTDKQYKRGVGHQHLLTVAAHSSTWLPVKFLAGFYICARPCEQSDTSAYQASAPVFLEGCVSALRDAQKSRKFIAPIVCFPWCSCSTAARPSANPDPFVLTVCAEWRRGSAKSVLSAAKAAAGEYAVYLSPPLQFENSLPVAVDVVMRTQATFEPAALVTPRVIRNACPSSTGPLCVVAVSNDTSHCLHGETLSNACRVQARTVSAYSTAVWHSEFVQSRTAGNATSYSHQGQLTFAIKGAAKMQTRWTLKLVDEGSRIGHPMGLNLAAPHVHTHVLREYRPERGGSQLRPAVHCRVSHHQVERVVVLHIQLRACDRQASRSVTGLRVRRFSVKPGATVDVCVRCLRNVLPVPPCLPALSYS